MVVGHPELGILYSTTMKRNNDINDGSRGRDGNGGDDAKRPRSLSESSFGDHSNQQQQHLHLMQQDHNDTDWLLAHNQQRLQMLAQSDALAAVAAAAGGHHHHNHPSLNLHQPQLDDLNPISRAGGSGGMGEAAVGLAAQQAQQQPQRVLALENAQTQLAAAMIRQRQAEDTLRQCQQQQAAAVAEYLQQQAMQQQQQLSPHHHPHFGGNPQGTSSNNNGSTTAGAPKSPVPQQAVFNDPTALAGGLYDHLQQQPTGSTTTNQQQAAMSRNSIAAAAAGGMSYGANERIYRIPVDHFASYNTTTERLVPNRHHATSTTNSNHNDEAAAAAAVFNATNMGETNGTATFNVSNANIVPGYSSFLLSSTPAPLDSHLAPVPMALPVQLAGSVTAGGGGGGGGMMKKEYPPVTKPRKSAKHKSSSSSTGSASSATGAAAAVSSPITPKISIAGPKRRPVSLQALVNRGDACYDPGPVRELALPSDRGNLSEYQCLLRKQIVLFSVSINDIQCSAQGRNKPIVIGQVGVLCRHCARIPPGMRPCGASYFPGKLSGLYQVRCCCRLGSPLFIYLLVCSSFAF
jgi:hypothetical protein